MATVATQPQIHMEEITIDDAALTATIKQWAEANRKRKAYNADIKALMIDDLKEKVEATLLDYGIADIQRPVLFRVPGTGLTIKVSPPGEAKDVEFTTSPKRRMSLKEEKDED